MLCQQEAANQLAKQSIFACARLAGYHNNQKEEGGPPDNPTVKKSLMAMLTPYLARKLADPDPSEVKRVGWGGDTCLNNLLLPVLSCLSMMVVIV